MAFGLMDTFIYKGKKPNFSRDQFQTLEEMIGYPEYYLPDTFIATCVEDGNAYLFNRNNSINAASGKWRKLAGGFHTKQVDRLPLGSLDPDDEEAIIPNTLYVVPNALGLAEGKRIEDTFMYIGDKWVQITNAIISRDNISKEFNDELTAIYNAIGETNDKELYSITKRIYDEAAGAAYKQKVDGTVVTIGEAIGALEQFVEDLDPITGEEVKAEFEKTTV